MMKMENKVRTKNLMESLRDEQIKKGFVSKETIARLAMEYGKSEAQIRDIVKNNDRLSLKPDCQYVIRVCDGTVCEEYNPGILLQVIWNKLALVCDPALREQTTSDGRFRLELTKCLSACTRAPMLTVNDEIYGEMTAEKTSTLLDRLI